MRYINLRFTYLLTYLLGCWQVDALSVYQHDQRLLCVVWRLKIGGGNQLTQISVEKDL